MLPKSQRLSVKEVELVMTKGSPIFSNAFVFKFLKKQDNQDSKGSLNMEPKNLSFLKISAVAPKKIFPNAVDRNKARRKIYNLLKEFQKSDLFRNGGQKNTKISALVAIIGSKNLFSTTKEHLVAEVEQVFTKSGIL